MPFPGFIFWGVFLGSALILCAYLAWMLRLERAERLASTSEQSDRDR